MQLKAILLCLAAAILATPGAASAEADRPTCELAPWASPLVVPADHGLIKVLANRTDVIGFTSDVRICAVDGEGNKWFDQQFRMPAGASVQRQIAVPVDRGNVTAIVEMTDGTQGVAGWARYDLESCSTPRAALEARLRNTLTGIGGSFYISPCTPATPEARPSSSGTHRAWTTRGTATIVERGPESAVVAASILALGALGVLFWKFLLSTPLGFGLFTRLRRSHLLDQDVRGHIFEAVQHEPGIRLSEVGDRLQLPQGVLRHHVRQLLAHGLLREVRRGRQRHLFTLEARTATPQAIVVLRQRAARTLYECVQRHPGDRLARIAEAAGLRLPYASKLAKELRGAGLIQRDAYGGLTASNNASESPAPSA